MTKFLGEVEVRGARKLACGSLIPLVLLSGCATAPVGYTLRGIQTYEDAPFAQSSVLVQLFEDVRPQEPTTRTLFRSFTGPKVVSRSGLDWFSNYGRNYRTKGGIQVAITRMVAKHLAASRLFRSAKFDSSSKESADYKLSGQISKFEAFKEVGPSGSTWFATTGAGLLGSLVTAGVQSRYEATTHLSSLNLIETATNQSIWAGQIENHITGSDYADPHGFGVYEKANLSLKGAVDDLITKLSRVDPRAGMNPETHD